MDPIAVTMAVQTVIFTATLIVLILQAKSQVEATRLEVYSTCQADYSSLVRMLIQQGNLQSIYDDLRNTGAQPLRWNDYSDREKALYSYFELSYELFERVFVLSTKRWIDSETWDNWDVWLTEICRHPIFKDVCKDTAGMFDSGFEEYVKDKVSPVSSKASERT